MMAVHTILGGIWGSHVVYHSHAIPDAVTLAGLTTFITAPYAINKLHAAVSSFAPQNEQVKTP